MMSVRLRSAIPARPKAALTVALKRAQAAPTLDEAAHILLHKCAHTYEIRWILNRIQLHERKILKPLIASLTFLEG